MTKHIVTIHKPNSSKVATEIFTNYDRACRWAAHAVSVGYVVDLDGKVYKAQA